MFCRSFAALLGVIGWALLAPGAAHATSAAGFPVSDTLPAGVYCNVGSRASSSYLMKRHTLTVIAGNQYTIDCISTNTSAGWQANKDTYIYLVPTGATGNSVIEQNDDVILGGDLRSRIIYEATADGVYDIVVTAWANIGYGANPAAVPPVPGFDGIISYNLTVDVRAITGAITGTAAPDPTNPLAASGSSPMTGRHTVNMVSGSIYSIDVTGENGDYDFNVNTYLHLYDQNGALVASNDDYGNGYASKISNYTASSTGSYTIIVTILTAGISTYHLNVTTATPLTTSTPITPLGTGIPNVRLSPRLKRIEVPDLPTLLPG